MTAKNDDQALNKSKCEGHCTYKISINGLMLICVDCGRVKAIRDNGSSKWEMLF